MRGRTVDHLLVGGGIASATCAAELRALGSDGSILVVGREAHEPYHRPPVTKGYLQGFETRAETLLHPSAWWPENDIELLTGTAVVALHPQARSAELSNGEEVRFGQALLATGARTRRLAVPGAELGGIHFLRTLGDADRLRRSLADADQVVIVGGSYVACEVAASLRTLGRRCTLVMPEANPLQTAFGATAGQFLRRVLEAHGVKVIGGDLVERCEGLWGRVRVVLTKAGRRLDADAVVVGVGAQPDAMLGSRAGLRLGESGGVRCDAFLRSSHPAVFGAGDACEYDSVIHQRRLGFDHENAAVEQARTVGHNMLGPPRIHRALPYCTSDLADWASLEYVGPALTWEEEAVRGSVDDGQFTVWYLNGARLVAALMVGRSEDLDHACALIAAQTDLGPRRHQLSDPDSDLAGITDQQVRVGLQED